MSDLNNYMPCQKCSGWVNVKGPHVKAVLDSGKVVYYHKDYCIDYAQEIIISEEHHSGRRHELSP